MILEQFPMWFMDTLVFVVKYFMEYFKKGGESV